MSNECTCEFSVRERVAVVEALLGTVGQSLDRLVSTVGTLAELVNQQRGQNEVRSRTNSALIAVGGGLAASVITLLVTQLLHVH